MSSAWKTSPELVSIRNSSNQRFERTRAQSISTSHYLYERIGHAWIFIKGKLKTWQGFDTIKTIIITFMSASCWAVLSRKRKTQWCSRGSWFNFSRYFLVWAEIASLLQSLFCRSDKRSGKRSQRWKKVSTSTPATAGTQEIEWHFSRLQHECPVCVKTLSEGRRISSI